MWLTLKRPVKEGCDILPDSCEKFRRRLEVANGEYRIPIATIEELIELHDKLNPSLFNIKREKDGRLVLFTV